MSRRTETRTAFVLRRVLFADNDLILTLLCKEGGRISVRARGARASKKRFGGRLSLFRKLQTIIDIDDRFQVSELKEVSVERDFPALEASFEKIAFASYSTELVRVMLFEEDGSAPPFELLEDVYDAFSNAPNDVIVLELSLDHFIYRLLDWWGRAPSVSRCHRCGVGSQRIEKKVFLRNGEGLICPHCRRENDAVGLVSDETFYILSFISGEAPSNPDKLANPESIRQVRRVLHASLGEVLTLDLKSLKVLKPLLC